MTPKISPEDVARIIDRLEKFVGMIEVVRDDEDEAFNDYMHEGLPGDIRAIIALLRPGVGEGNGSSSAKTDPQAGLAHEAEG